MDTCIAGNHREEDSDLDQSHCLCQDGLKLLRYLAGTCLTVGKLPKWSSHLSPSQFQLVNCSVSVIEVWIVLKDHCSGCHTTWQIDGNQANASALLGSCMYSIKLLEVSWMNVQLPGVISVMQSLGYSFANHLLSMIVQNIFGENIFSCIWPVWWNRIWGETWDHSLKFGQ